jgi:ABC-2 type transport system permease protein
MQNQAAAAGTHPPKLSQLLPPYFEAIHFLLIFIIPALSMGTFAEERKNNTLRLFLSSPISVLSVVMGKFGGNFLLLMSVIATTFIYPLYLNLYGHYDLSLLVSGYLGVTLLICQSLAFGMWISALSNNQFTAFLATVFGMFGFLIISSLASLIRGQSLLYKMLKYIGIADHYGVFTKGMITVADLSYFFLMTALFLFFTVIAFEGFRWR